MTEASVSKIQKVMAGIHALANLIKSIGTIFGFITATYIAAVNYFPATFAGKLLASAGDQLIATQRFSEGFLYYEVGKNGELTPHGQLVALPGEKLPDFNSLSAGLILKAKSTVYLRPKPTKDEDFTRVLGAGQCFEILKRDRELSSKDLRGAKNGGWLSVAETSCPT